MGFESSGMDNFSATSPGGHEFGVHGWTWGPPVPKTITFFLDGSAMVCDQYGRHIRTASQPDGSLLKFADSAPEANQDGRVVQRPQFATHAETIAALEAERIDWQSYEVRYQDRGNNKRVRSGLSLQDALKLQRRLLQDGNNPVLLARTISCAGWPQLPYEELKKLLDVPPTPALELAKIPDPALRRDALKFRKEVDARRASETATAELEV